jgi:energy-coupling factor transporter ATP-binding protein EcfA2
MVVPVPVPLPESAKEKIWNGVVAFLVEQAKKYGGDEFAKRIDALRSDRELTVQVNKAIEHAAARFGNEYPDKDLARALTEDTHFYDLQSVRNAVREMMAHPYSPAPMVMVEQSLADVLRTVDRARVNDAAQFFLERLREELIGVKKLNETLGLMLQLESLQANKESAATEKEMAATLQRIEKVLAPEALPFDELKQKYLAHVVSEWRKIRLIGFSHGRTDVDDPLLEDVFVPLHAEQAARAKVELGIPDLLRALGQDERLFRSKFPGSFERSTEIRAIHDVDVTATKRTVSLNDVLAGAQRMVILGAPGAGKSTLLQYIALMFARGQAKEKWGIEAERLPVRVILREFARERNKREAGYALEDYLHDYYHARGKEFSPEFFRHFIEHGECILLFDGMDEVGTAAQRIEMRDLIESLSRAHSGNRVVVSSRPTGYEAAPLDQREFDTFSLLDFDDDDIKQFITNWYRAVEGRNDSEAKVGAEKLSEDLERNPNVKRLAVNPLLLTIIATIHRTERLPNQRVRLYDKCAESLLVKWCYGPNWLEV